MTLSVLDGNLKKRECESDSDGVMYPQGGLKSAGCNIDPAIGGSSSFPAAQEVAAAFLATAKPQGVLALVVIIHLFCCAVFPRPLFFGQVVV